MTRAEKREMRLNLQKEIAAFIRIQNHVFPNLIKDMRAVLDTRKQNYITYEIEVILYVMIMKNVCSIASMQEMTDSFNMEECARNIFKILGLPEKDYLPHYVTVNDCLKKLDNAELEKLRKKMIYNMIRGKAFDKAKFLGEYWLVIVDASQLFCFDERHCEHCLKKTVNKGKPEEKTYYYHEVLEAKIAFSDGMIISLATEFIENPNESPTKQDCELNSFKRLAVSLKKMFPRLPICLLADSLYACQPVFEICRANNWEFLIRFKDGSIPTLATEFYAIMDMGEADEAVKDVEKVFKRKANISEKHKMRWVNDLDYQGKNVAVLELEIERNRKKWKQFKWISSQPITVRRAAEFAETGRKRWMIENEGFNIQKNHRYIITHANSLNYNAMKNHYLLTQIADILLQLYEIGVKGLRLLMRTIENISKSLLDCLQKEALTTEDLTFEKFQMRT